MSNKKNKEDTISQLKNSAHDIQDSLNEAANQAGRKVRSALNSANGDITHVSDKITTEINANPVRSSVIALGAGVLIGTLLRLVGRSK